MFFSIARLVTPILLAILSAVIEGSEITRSIIFCAVLLTFFGVFDVSPNLSAFTPNFSTELSSLAPNFSTELSSLAGYFSRVLFTLLATSSTGILPFSLQFRL